jgi:PAS domain S-box-containing protein
VLTPTRTSGPALSLEHLAFDQAGVGMAYMLRDRFVRVNRAFSDLIGQPVDKIEGASFLDFTHPDQRQQKRADFEVLLHPDRPQVTSEDLYILPDGSESWVSINASRVALAEADCLIVAKDITARILVERELREERDKLHAALASMTDAVFICDSKGNFINFNQAFVALSQKYSGKPVGLKRLDRKGVGFELLTLDGQVLATDEWPVSRALRGEVGIDEQFIVRRNDTGENWFASYNFAPLRTADGRNSGCVVVTRDVTERVLAKRQLQEERDKLHAAMASMTDAVFICDRQGDFVDFNQAFAALFLRFSGKADVFTSLDQYGEDFDVLAEDGQTLAPEEWPVSRALHGEIGIDEQFIVRRKDTGESWFASYNFAPLLTADGEISGCVVVARDVTERILIKRELQAERDKLKTALFNMPDAVFIGDGIDDAPDFNDAFVSFMRFPDREQTLRTLADYPAVLELYTLSGELLAMDQWPLPRAMRGEAAVDEQYRFLRTDTGEWWFASSNFAPIRTPDGAISGAAVIFRDITEAKLASDALLATRDELERMVEERTKRLAEAKLEADRANAAKTRFLAAASHDLRQPLQAAKAYLGALELLPPGSNASTIMTGLETALAVMAGLLGTMLDMSRLQSGFVEPQLTVFPLALLLEQIAHANLPAAQSKGLEMRTAFQPCMVSTDRALLLSAVHNLMSNAVKYTEKGFVAVQCRVADNVVTIEIEDSGIGISEEDRSAIFLEYVQLANPARNPDNGVGLGLSLVTSALDLLGISLRMDSLVGQGTRFAFDLPCIVPPEGRSDAQLVTPGAEVAATVILVVEDDKAVRESFVLLLHICGYTVRGVETGADALAYVAGGHAFDVMITDYRLHDTYGTDVIREARKIRGVAFPTILITGETQLDDISAQDIVNCRIMSKPVKIPVMMDAIAQLTRTSALARSQP